MVDKMEKTIQPRMTAEKVAIKDIIGGNFTKVEEEYQPSYLITPLGQKLSRVHIFGLVVGAYSPEEGAYASITVDDGTAAVRLKVWKEEVSRLANIKAGDMVDVIGRIRAYNDEIYILPETVVVADDPNFELMRKLEIAKARKKFRELRLTVLKTAEEIEDPAKLKDFLREKIGMGEETIDTMLAAKVEPPKEEQVGDAKSLVLALIKKGGKEGLDYNELLRSAGISTEQVDDSIRDLIEDGEIFEPKSGRFRVLS